MRMFVLVLCAVLGLAPLAFAAEDPPAAPSAAPAATPPVPAASPDPYAGLPKPVVGAIKELEAACRDEGGTAKWTAKGLVDEVDFSHDGQPDYLIDTHGVECSASVTPWIGSDGFRHIIFISKGKGKWVRAFDRSARGLELITKDGETRLILFSHSGDCTRPNPKRYQRCTQEYAWRHGKLKLIDEEWFTD